MAWIKATDILPEENEQILIHDGPNNRIELGRYVKGRWFIEDERTGRLREIACVTHWAVILDSWINDTSDDD